MNAQQTLIIAIGVIVLLVVYLGVMIPFLLTMQNALKAVSPENRRMRPGLVWLSLIPYFNYIWNFFLVIRVSESLDEELYKRGIPAGESKPGYGAGMAYCVLALVALIPLFLLKVLATITALICFIVFWVKIYNYKSQLKSMLPKNEPGMRDILDSEFRS